MRTPSWLEILQLRWRIYVLQTVQTCVLTTIKKQLLFKIAKLPLVLRELQENLLADLQLIRIV